MSTAHATDCVVIGAGMAGLAAASLLHRHGIRTIVLDKGRGVGGRMATRRIAIGGATAVVDHGAQFFTARDEEFRRCVDAWRTAGTVDEWFVRDGARLRGTHGMTDPPKALTDGLDIRLGVRVTAVRARDTTWAIEREDGTILTATTLIATAPVPQTLALLAAGEYPLPAAARTALEAIDYDPCLALLAVLDGPSRIPLPGALDTDTSDLGSELRWIADNRQKGISPVPALTLHAAPDCSRELWEASEADVTRTLLAAAGDLVGSRVVATQLHRWRYAQPTSIHEAPALDGAGGPPLLLAGDAFAGGRVENAYQSGRAAARRLLVLAAERALFPGAS